MKIAFVFCLLVATQLSFGQYFKTYKWDETPAYEKPPEELIDNSTVGLLQRHFVEYTSSSQIEVFATTHIKTFVKDDKGVNENNKVYIPMRPGDLLVDIMARTFTEAGELQTFDRSNIKDVSNVDEYGDFKIFALEGVQRESVIEVIYTVKKNFYPFGWETLQQDYPVLNVHFSLIHNANRARVKAYRTESSFKEIASPHTAQELTIDFLPAMVDEEFATPRSNKVAVAYHCFHKNNPATNELIWKNVVRNICDGVFPSTPVAKVYKDIKATALKSDSGSELETVMKLDNFIKSQYTVTRSSNPDLSNVKYVVKNRSGNPTGILKAYGHYLTALGVRYEVAITSNRYLHHFDPYFFTPRAIQDFLIYLPDLKMYIAPDRLEYRVGEAPFNVLGSKAMFVSKDLRHFPGTIRQNDPDFSRINRIITATFNPDISESTIEEYQEYYGHWAVTNRAVLSFSSQADKDEFEDYLTGSGIEDKQQLSYALGNEALNQIDYNVPFTVNSTISSSSMIEDAGGMYIFLVGKVIGTQSELYQEEDRVNPILSRYPNVYNYTIKVEIPEGFQPDGLEDLKIHKELKNEDTVICKFESDYELDEEGNVVITIEEFYKQIDIPVHMYDGFRSVINAASDFNKASILLSPN